jgi:hypothetical protein
MAITPAKHRLMADAWNAWTLGGRDFRPTPMVPGDVLKTYQQNAAKHGNSGLTWIAVTPNDAADLAQYALALWVNVAGNVVVVDVDQNTDATTRTYTALPQGVHRIRARRVFATGTTATGIEALVPVTVTQTDL